MPASLSTTYQQRPKKLWLTLFNHHGLELFEHKIELDVRELAKKVCVYNMLYHPDDNGVVIAEDLHTPVVNAFKRLEYKPEQFNPTESSYVQAQIKALSEGLEAIAEGISLNPYSVVHVSY